MGPLKVLIADDEPLARERMARLLREAECEVLGELEDGPSLLEWMAANSGTQVDALFLDIKMPGLNGLEALAELSRPPLTVFVTAYSDYAIQAFEAAAVDYLLKPIYWDRLARTLERIRARMVRKLTPAEWHALLPPLQRVAIKAGSGTVFLELKHFTYFELVDDRVWGITPTHRHLTAWTTLQAVEEAFPGAGLLRIQRHQLLRPEAVLGCRSLAGGRLQVHLAKGVELEVSRAMAPTLRTRLSLD